MRTVWLVWKLAVLVAVVLPLLFAMDVTSKPSAAQSRTAKANTPGKGTKDAKSCNDPKGKEIRLGVLDGADADALAQTLSSVFTEFIVTSEAEKQAGSSGSTDDSASSSKSSKNNPKHLCVFDRATGRTAPDSVSLRNLTAVVQRIDHDNFKGAGLNSNFILLATEVEPVNLQDLKSVFPHPTSSFDLMFGDMQHYLLLPSPEAMGQPSSASALGKQAAGIKHDLLALAAQMALPDDGRDRATADALRNCLYPCFQTETIQWVQSEQTAHVERWIDRHTVRLAALDPRAVMSALSDYFGSRDRRLVLLAKMQSIIVLPAAARDTTPAILSAEAIERDMLYRQEQADKSAQAAAAKAASSKSDSSSSPATTTSPTIKTTVTDGTSKTPTTTTVTTITSPQAISSSNAAGPEKSATGITSSGQSQSTGGSQGGGAQVPSQSQVSTSVLKTWPKDQPFPMDRVQRLYHFRHAKAIADAINKGSGSKDVDLVEPLGDSDDLLLILPPTSPDGHDPYEDILRAIATIDLPRPQLSLQVWSYQISGKDKSDRRGGPSHRAEQTAQVQRSYEEVRTQVLKSNEQMMRALQKGFGAILTEVANVRPENFFDPTFAGYLTGRYHECVSDDHYCLGYYGALDAPSSGAGDAVLDASLGRIFLFLAAARNKQAQTAVTSLIRDMQDPQCNDEVPVPSHLCFPNFKEQLDKLVQPRNLSTLRAALLDFFFQYKQVFVYFNDFIPYYLQRTAHEVDDLLTPVVAAFDEDLDNFVTGTFASCTREQDEVDQCRRGNSDDASNVCDSENKKRQRCFRQRVTGLLTSGMVQVTAISGTDAQVSGKVDNYFDITPPMSLSDILNPNPNAVSTLKNILEPKEITLLSAVANMGSQARIHAQVSENASLTITPTALDTASSAELKVDFDVGEPTGAPPGSVDSKAAQADILNRVENHHVTTDVRVESLKLFQLSSFTMDLTHPERGAPFPVIGQAWEAVFGTMPGVDRLFHFPPTMHTIENRSIAIIRAVVVPTAMDLGLSIPFETDRISDPETNTTDPINSTQQIGGRMRPFHKKLMSCLRKGEADCWSTVKLSALPDDQR